VKEKKLSKKYANHKRYGFAQSLSNDCLDGGFGVHRQYGGNKRRKP
jgi:hypothetical protein